MEGTVELGKSVEEIMLTGYGGQEVDGLMQPDRKCIKSRGWWKQNLLAGTQEKR